MEKQGAGDTFSRQDSLMLKGIAISLMLFHHLFNDYEEYRGMAVSSWPFSGDRLQEYAIAARLCVALFVFITGYGLTKTCQRSGAPDARAIGRASFKRYWKLMSVYWFVFLAALLCQGLGRTFSDAYGTNPIPACVYFLADVLGMSYAFGTPTLNPTWWYMELAILFIFLVPLIAGTMKKYHALTVAVPMYLLLLPFGTSSLTSHYIVVLLVGIVAAQTGLMEKMIRRKGPAKALLIAVSLCLVVLLHKADSLITTDGLIEGWIAFHMAFLVHEIVARIPVISCVLEFLGRHSEHTFLFHNLLYSFYFKEFFYSFYYWPLIVLALLAVSTVISVGMEWVERRSGYLAFMNRVGERIMGDCACSFPESSGSTAGTGSDQRTPPADPAARTR